MLMREKSKPGSEPVAMSWDEAQAALQTGKYDIASEGPEGESMKPAESKQAQAPVGPSAQVPAPSPLPTNAEKSAKAS